MKKYVFVLAILMLCSYNSFAQKTSRATSDKNMGIGVRLGDPSGVTFKKYFGKTALELNAGIPTYIFGGYNYNHDYNKRHRKNGYYGYGYDRGFGFAFQAHVTRLFDIRPVEGLQWYVGGGLQARQFSYNYYYYDDFGYYHKDRASYFQFGVDATGGAEYTFADAPFSVFADLTFFVNFVNDPGVYVQPGIGGRFNF